MMRPEVCDSKSSVERGAQAQVGKAGQRTRYHGGAGEPIVCNPEGAFRCFMGNELDILAVGNCYFRKEDQDLEPKQNYGPAFDLD